MLGVALGMALVAAIIWLVQRTHPTGGAALSAPVAVSPAPAKGGENTNARHNVRPNDMPQTARGDSPRQTGLSRRSPRLRAVSPAIAAAFPGLAAVQADWREFRPDTLTVAPHPDLPITFTRVAVKDEGRYVTWIGRNPLIPGASLVGVATAGGYDAILIVPGASQFSFHVHGDAVVIEEANPGEEGCGVDPVQLPKAALAAGPSVQSVGYAAGFDPDAAILAATPALNVDVLFAYDTDTLAAAAAQSADAAGYIDGQCKALIESANVALSQSGVTAFAWRYLGAVAVPAHTRTGSLQADLDAAAPGGSLFDWVKTTRYQQGADQVMLLVADSDNSFIGLAYSPKQVAVTKELAVAVAVWGASYRVIAHELAHNFGCQHDRAHVEVLENQQYGPPAPDDDGFWCYGLMWRNPPPAGYTGNLGTGGTIMSYADWIIPYFSNPNITVQLTGALFEWRGWGTVPVLGVQQLGQPETAAAAAYNARVLNEQAEAMSNLSEEILIPAITIQPHNASVPRGQSFTLGVTATGGGLSYQWLKNGVAIAGAQGSSYAKSAEATEPDGYSVIVSNLKGSVTSDVVTVTVTAPPPSSGGGSGGGGGGGELGAWFSAALATLAVLRRTSRGKRR